MNHKQILQTLWIVSKSSSTVQTYNCLRTLCFSFEALYCYLHP